MVSAPAPPRDGCYDTAPPWVRGRIIATAANELLSRIHEIGQLLKQIQGRIGVIVLNGRCREESEMRASMQRLRTGQGALLLILVVLAVALIAAACGGDDDEDAGAAAPPAAAEELRRHAAEEPPPPAEEPPPPGRGAPAAS